MFQRNSVWYADGRSNERNPGRHSLGTRRRADAEHSLGRLDLARAIDMGLAQPEATRTAPHAILALVEGRRLYEAHLDGPRIAGGVRASTKKR
jgi:hypothetical protein